MKLRVALLACCMLVTGSLNTIATKLQDNVVVGHDAAGRPLHFRHPAFQTAAMFLGEALCLIPFAIRRWYKAATRDAPLSAEEAAERGQRLRGALAAFSLPALCDTGASTLLNLGLFYTYASVFQMLRGTLVVFAGLLTVTLLKRSLHSHHWLGIVLICAGAALVGASSLVYGGEPRGAAAGGAGAGERALLALDDRAGWTSPGSAAAPNPMLGNVLVVLAQLLAAAQFIVEEKYLVKYRAPVLLVVGLEGCWGLALCCVALPVLQFVPGPGGQPFDSVTQALKAVAASATLQWTTAATVCSIAAFNFFGVSVTKNLSGAARATIDACRTLFVWLFALSRGWERFSMLQVVGFLVLLSGTSVYNEILRSCLPAAEPRRHRRRSLAAHDAEAALGQPLLGQGEGDLPDEQTAAALKGAHGSAGVRFAADAPASRPIAAAAGAGAMGRARYTMARSVTILPAALSPHSLASVPSGTFGGASFTFSVPRNLSRGGLGGDGGEEEEGAGGGGYSDSEVSGSDTERGSSRDPSQHGAWAPSQHRSCGAGSPPPGQQH